MYKIEGYWDVVPKIKKVTFPLRGKMSVALEDGRIIDINNCRTIAERCGE